MSYSKEYYAKNKKKILETSRRWLAKKPLKRILSVRKARVKYQQTARGIYAVIQGNARRKNREVLSRESFIRWYDKQKKVCHYCEAVPNGKRLSIDRIKNSIGYRIGNLTLACYECNKVKGDILTEAEMLIVGKVVMKKRWK